jgi:type II secretory pathway pseudopilin PulG
MANMTLAARMHRKQKGISLVGLIIVLAIIGLFAVLAMKVTPTVTEYFSIKKAIVSVKAAGGGIPEMRSAFNRQAEVGYIDAISGKDLEILKNGEDVEINFAYQKTIPLVGPVSLLIDYAGSTNENRLKKKAAP